MRFNYYFTLFILFSQIASSQDIIVHYGYNTYHSILISSDFTQFNDNFCNKTYGFGPVCYQQNGLLYTTSGYNSRKGNLIVFNVDLKYVDLVNCDTNLILNTCGNTISPLNLFVDYSGRIYCCDRLNPFDSIKLYRCDNEFNNIQVLRGVSDLPEALIHDMVILGTEVIALNNNYNQLYVMDTNFILQKTIHPGIQITKLTSKYINCKDRRLIVAGYPYSQAVYDSLKMNPNHKLNDTLYLFDYDYKVDTFKLLGKHFYTHTGKATIPSLTSFDDILSSDPECEFLLDLDRNNSSGLFPYDFKYTNEICVRDTVPIVDEDLYLESDLRVDSLQITISSPKDAGVEQIVLADANFKNYLHLRNDSLYSLVFASRLDIAQLKPIIQSLRYVHDGLLDRTAGERAVKIRLFAEGNVQRQAVCSLQVALLALVERDTTICYNDSLTDEMLNVYYPGDTMINLYGKNRDGCDSIEVLKVKAFPKENLTIHGDSILCHGAQNELCISGGRTFVWSSGNHTQCIEINKDGIYQASVKDANHCQYHLEFKVSRPDSVSYKVDLTPPICFGDQNGKISILSQSGLVEYFMGSQKNTSGKFTGLAAGEYVLGFYDRYHCLYKDTIVLKDPPEISLTYPDTLIVKDRVPELLSIFDNHQTITEIKLIPEQGSRNLGVWNFELNPEQGGQYTIIAKDSNGCSRTFPLVVLLDLNYQVYYPNVFSPNGDGVNDLWNVSIGSGYQGDHLEIYDRWGNKLYRFTKDEIGSPDRGWNGIHNAIRCLPGVYVFRLTVKNDLQQIKNVVGTISLLR